MDCFSPEGPALLYCNMLRSMALALRGSYRPVSRMYEKLTRWWPHLERETHRSRGDGQVLQVGEAGLAPEGGLVRTQGRHLESTGSIEGRRPDSERSRRR